MARPTKLTPAVQHRLVEALRSGNWRVTACRYAGITYQTFLNWLERGEKAKSGQFLEFFDAVVLAEAEAEMFVVANWRAQIPRSWQAAREYLARRHPDRWGTVSSSPTQPPPLPPSPDDEPPEEWTDEEVQEALEYARQTGVFAEIAAELEQGNAENPEAEATT